MRPAIQREYGLGLQRRAWRSALAAAAALFATAGPLMPVQTASAESCTVIPIPTQQQPTTCPNKNLTDQYLNFNNQNLSHANFSNSTFDHMTLTPRFLAGANLRSASLIGTTIVGVNAEGADFTNAKLNGANFLDTNLKDAIVSGTILQPKSRWPEKESVTTAMLFDSTKTGHNRYPVGGLSPAGCSEIVNDNWVPHMEWPASPQAHHVTCFWRTTEGVVDNYHHNQAKSSFAVAYNFALYVGRAAELTS